MKVKGKVAIQLLAVGAGAHKVLDKSRAFFILTSSIFTYVTVEEMMIFES
jgi:hypothetical protein